MSLVMELLVLAALVLLWLVLRPERVLPLPRPRISYGQTEFSTGDLLIIQTSHGPGHLGMVVRHRSQLFMWDLDLAVRADTLRPLYRNLLACHKKGHAVSRVPLSGRVCTDRLLVLMRAYKWTRYDYSVVLDYFNDRMHQETGLPRIPVPHKQQPTLAFMYCVELVLHVLRRYGVIRNLPMVYPNDLLANPLLLHCQPGFRYEEPHQVLF